MMIPDHAACEAIGTAISALVVQKGDFNNTNLGQSDLAGQVVPATHLPFAELPRIFVALGKAAWNERLHNPDLLCLVDTGSMLISHLATWWVLEDTFDGICHFLQRSFEGFVLRERQSSRIRAEISQTDAKGQQRRLAAMFGIVESRKVALGIQVTSMPSCYFTLTI